jgi:hypothetical protein
VLLGAAAVVLGAYLAGRPDGPEDRLTAPPGEPLRQSNRVPGYFKPAARPTTLRFSDLWHTAVSLLIRKQLGHATASIALDTYGDVFPDELDALAGRLETSTAGRWRRRGPPRCDPAVARRRHARRTRRSVARQARA